MSILKNLLGPSKDDVWAKIAKDIGGEYIDGGFWKKDELKYEHKNWNLHLDTYTTGGKHSQTYTRMRAPFFNQRGFRFRVTPKHLFSGIGKFFGAQDIEIGDLEFDEEFIIKTNNIFLGTKCLKSVKN